MTYNITALQNTANEAELLAWANNATSGVLVGGFMFVVFFGIIILMRGYDFARRLLASGFICFVLSLFLRWAELINFTFVIAFLIIAALSGLYIVLAKR